MSSDIFLFTYNTSVFGRRTDWYLTLRGLKYYQCIQPNRLPRPDLETLGIAYRRIPILAIGRDVYCDSRIIIEKLEELFPENRLGSETPFDRGIERLLEAYLIDAGPFWRTSSLIPSNAELMLDQKWLEDRSEMTGRSFTRPNQIDGRPEGLAHVRMYFDIAEHTWLADGRRFILNTDHPTLADIHGIWTFDWALQSSLGMKDALETEVISEKLFPKTFAWVHRFREALKKAEAKNGKPEILSGNETIKRILSSNLTDIESSIDNTDPLKLKKGQEVEIWPIETGFNHHDRGKLVTLNLREIVIESKVRHGDGHLRLHFPRQNFRIKLVSDSVSQKL